MFTIQGGLLYEWETAVRIISIAATRDGGNMEETMKRPLFRWGGLLLLLGVVVGGIIVIAQPFDGDSTSSSAGETDDTNTIILIQTPSKSSIANNAVAKILLEEEMGYTVEIVDIRDDRYQARALITGDASVNLEIWSSGMDAAFSRYLEANIITNMGPLGVTGHAGWYIPTYLHDEYPQLHKWETLQEDEITSLFAQPDGGGRGVLLSGDPYWDAYLEMLVQNLDLSYDVVYTGSEDTLLEAVDRAYEQQEPVLFYLWEPHPFLLDHDFTRIKLPPFTEECYELIESGGVNCEYPRDVLFKVAHPALEQDAPEAFEFVRKFFYPSNEAQVSLMEAIEASATTEAGAHRWLRENEDIWQSWLPDAALQAPSNRKS
jgi:glycine betaine/proline transport system substrate-binding protein